MSLRKDITALIQDEKEYGPFVSIFMRVHAQEGEETKDKSQFRDLMDRARTDFEKKYPKKDWGIYEAKLQWIDDERIFGNNTAKSMVVIAGIEHVFQYYLDIDIENRVLVSDTLDVLPVIANGQFNVNYDILRLDKKTFGLYQVNNGLVRPYVLPSDAPTSIAEAIGTEITGGVQRQKAMGPGTHSVFHGHDARSESDNSDERIYYGIVDDYVIKNFSIKTQRPLILMAIPEVAGEFYKISKNLLLSRDIKIDKMPPKVDKVTMQKSADKVNAQFEQIALDGVKTQIDNARSGKRAVDIMSDITEDAIEGRLDALVLAKEAFVPGIITLNQEVDTTSEAAQQNNLLNDLAVTVLGYGGRVYILDQKELIDGEKAVGLLRGHGHQ